MASSDPRNCESCVGVANSYLVESFIVRSEDPIESGGGDADQVHPDGEQAGSTRLRLFRRVVSDRSAWRWDGIIRRCLLRTNTKCSFLGIEVEGHLPAVRLFVFVVAVDGDDENELAILEFIHSLVETLDRYFESVCELDIMYHIEKAHYIVNEMVSNGYIVENNKINTLNHLNLMDQIESDESIFNKLRS